MAFDDLQKTMVDSISETIRECHRTSAAYAHQGMEWQEEAAKLIVRAVTSGITKQSKPVGAFVPMSVLDEIDKTLRVDAAEYVPSIRDVFTIIDREKAKLVA